MKQTIRHIFGSTFTVATIFLAAGCSEYNPEEFNGNLTKEEYEKISEYTQNFTLRYGKMDPGHDWGFGELAPKGSKGTRGVVLVNKNEWFNKDEGKSADGSVIPGMPSSIDGRYILKNGGSNKDVMMYNDYSFYDVNNKLPAGDVTDEEIIYVSNWFRNNRKPISIDLKDLKLRDFYVQNVSWDYDRESYPDGAKVDKVTWTGSNGTEQSRGGLDCKMNHLLCVSYSDSDSNDGNHINNFNNNNTNMAEANATYDKISDSDKTECGKLFEYRTMERYKCADGEPDVKAFKAHSTNDNRYLTDYVLVHLEFIGPKSGKKYSGYYLAFDYSFDGSSESVNVPEAKKSADGYYSNWIIKISPAYPSTTPDDPTPGTTTTETRRVMCEDLGSTNDFDFNDLVFDVYYTYEEDAAGNKSDIQAHITLQAVGGTLPIYIGAQTTSDPTKELHYRMTHTYAKNPINVGAGTTCDPVTFMMSAETTDPNDLDIYVGSSDNKATDQIILPKSGNSSLSPQKICVPTTVRWLRESQQIEWGYTKFRDWVNSQKQNSFWNDGINESYLY